MAFLSCERGPGWRAAFPGCLSLSKKLTTSQKKIFLAMRLTALLLTACCLQVSARSFGQKVTISVHDAPVKQVLLQIKQQTGYLFFYNSDVLDDRQKISLDVKQAPILEVLPQLLQQFDLTYNIRNKTIFLQKAKNQHADDNNATLKPGPIDITGKVTNPNGEPLAGANIMVARTHTGTITDADGNFDLKNLKNDDQLVISYIGYETKKVAVGTNQNIAITLKIADNKLDEAVVEGYGTTSQRLATGNITTVTAKEIEHHPVMNVLQALQGRVPGLEVTPQNGFSSAPYKIEIRGRKYLNDNLAPDPLIIVDGVPLNVLNFQAVSPNGSEGFTQSGVPNPIGGQSPLFSLDPNEIESVTVLKDADATAIYGSRGGNGVIIITTKKGKAGPAKFNVSYSTGFQKNMRWFDLMNTKQYLEMRREAFKNDNITPDISNAPDLVKWDTTRYTDWQRFIYGGTGRTTKVNANVNGGDKYTKYRISLDYDKRTNITTKSGANERIAVANYLSHRTVNNLFKMEMNNTYSYIKINTVDLPISTLFLPPDAPPAFIDNKINFSGWDPFTSFVEPFGSLFDTYNSGTSYLNSNLSLSLLPLKGLTLKTSIGYNSFNTDEIYVVPIAGQNPLYNPTGTINEGVTKGSSWIVEPQAEYIYNTKHFKTSFMVGSSIQSVEQKTIGAAGFGFTDDNLLKSIANAPITAGVDAHGQYKYFAAFGRINLNYDDKYILNLNARRDGSSRFGPGKQFGNFWSIGGAWIMSDEDWFKPLAKVISFAKLRSSVGTVGSDNIGAYGYLTRWSGDRNISTPYGGSQTYQPTQHANPDLQWQKNQKLEIAGQFNFISDKVSSEISWYEDRCSDQLLQTPLPALTGFPEVSANLPATVQNSGWEVKLSAKIINSNKFKFNSSFNIGINRNKLIEFSDLKNTSYASRYIIGKPVNLAFLYKYTGVNPQTGEYTFNDKNHDGQIGGDPSLKDPDAYIFDLSPKYFGGFGFDFSFGSFTLNSYFTFANLPYLRGISSSTFPGNFGESANQPIVVLNRWQAPKDNAHYASYSTTARSSDVSFYNSTGSYSKGSYLNLENLNLSYSISKQLIRKLKIENANIFIQAENIYMFTNYEGLDPRSPGLGSYPLPFIVTIGANINL